MTDRPAAELLAELDVECARHDREDCPVSFHRDVLVRLARAEQALAEQERVIGRLFAVIRQHEIGRAALAEHLTVFSATPGGAA